MMTQGRNVNASLGGCLGNLGALWDVDRGGGTIIVVDKDYWYDRSVVVGVGVHVGMRNRIVV